MHARAEGARLYVFTQYLMLTVLERVLLPVLQTAWLAEGLRMRGKKPLFSNLVLIWRLIQRSSRWIFSTGMLHCLHNSQTVVWKSNLRKLMCHL